MGFVRRALVFALAGLAFNASTIRGQDISETPTPAHIAVVDGDAIIDRENQSEPAVASMPLVAGDRLRTEQGRLEVLFPDGTSLALDEFSSVELQAPTLLRVASGRLLLTVAGAATPSSAVHFQIDTPTASATTDGPGEYRIAILSGPSGIQTELAVVRGSGVLMTERGSMPLRAGERSVAWENAAPSSPQAFNSARFDAFDQWAYARRDLRLGSAASAQYLPADLRVYGGTFDRSGSWQYEAPYGYVWYPAVSAGWQPYYNGYWATVPHYGWTWIGVDVWAWPTHHYGRWGHSRSRWFWIPDARWATAWVSWGAAPGYVSWSPLGFDNRPVFGLSVEVGDPRRGWVTVPRRHFGHGRYVDRYAVSPRTIPVRSPFVVQAAPPIAPSRAVPRGNAPVGVAVPRGSTASGRSGERVQPPLVAGRSAADGSVASRGYAVGRQPSTPGFQAVPRGPDRQAAPGGFKAPLQAAPRAVQRFPNGQVRQPVQPAIGGAQQVHPGYQVPPARPGYQRRAPAGTPNPGVIPGQPANAPSARAPVRSPYMLSAPLGPTPQSPFAQPRPGAAQAVPRTAPDAPRAAAPGSLYRSAAPAQAAPAQGSAAPAHSPRAVPRRGAGVAPSAAAPQGPPAAAPRQHDPSSRRPPR